MENNNIFDENGFAIKDVRVKVYNYDRENREFISSTMEHTVRGSGIPAQSTLIENLELKDGFTQVFDEESQAWSYVEDHRYSDVYNIHTKQKEDIRYIGELKEEHTLLAPPSFDHEFIDGTWVITEEMRAELDDQVKQQRINELESSIQKLENDLVVANLRGKDITEILNEIDEVEAELENLK